MRVYLDFQSDLNLVFIDTNNSENLLERVSLLSKDELVHEKEKFKAISDELDQTFAEMSGY
jgi:hypothetical protein